VYVVSTGIEIPPVANAVTDWTAALDPSNLTVNPDGRSATLEFNDLPLIDEPTYPKPGPVYQATMSARIVWTGLGPDQTIENSTKHYALQAAAGQARGEFKVAVPEQNFTWASDPLESSMSTDVLIGREVNGRFYDQGCGLAVRCRVCPAPAAGRRCWTSPAWASVAHWVPWRLWPASR